jgi:HEAT repeat protein/energy-coupling factor transporter ATP-binding protein EcfA2
MLNPDELIAILDRILNGSQDESEIAELRQWLKVSDTKLQFVSQDGKFNTNIGQVQGGEIHIGDKIYQFDVEALRELLQPTTPLPNIDWHAVSQAMLEEQLRLTTNPLTSGEGISYRTEQVYVPLGLVERKRQTRRREDVPPEQGSLLYEETEITQRFEHEQFLERVLQQGQSPKSRGKRIAIIGEPGAGKTTLLQQIAQWVSKQVEGAIPQSGDLNGIAIWVSLADLRGQELEPYLLERWLQAVARKLGQAEASPQVKDAFVAQFQQGQVWLLLDGVDEMQVSSGNPLAEMSRQVRMGGLLSQARIVLNCRLNLWDGDRNALDTFDTYRTLEFSYPQQVEQFIEKWFGALSEGQGEQAERLCGALKAPRKERIQDLVKNPLRLTLLCFNWYLGEGTLPETKAGLYKHFVADFYEWKREQFPTTAEQRRQLNAALGELAREAIDKEETRFRLRHDFVYEFLGEPDEPDSLFWLALQLGWLNKVGVDAENPRKAVYAFFHSTFQEYFAALAIKDWDFFLPYEHNKLLSKPIEDKAYRIFNSNWRETILIWSGKSHELENKREFIKALINFQGGCHNFHFYRAYFLAAIVASEVGEKELSEEIISDLISLSFFTRFEPTSDIDKCWLHCPVQEQAKETLQLTSRSITVDKLIQAIANTSNLYQRNELAEFLGKISLRHPRAIEVLTQSLSSSEHKFTTMNTAKSLWLVDPGNSHAVNKFVELLSPDEDNIVSNHVAEAVGRNNIQSPEIITALINLSQRSGNDFTLGSRQVLRGLERLGIRDRYVIDTVIDLIDIAKNKQEYENQRVLIWVLGEVGIEDSKAFSYLVNLLHETDDKPSRWFIADSIGRIGINSPEVISVLTNLTSQDEDEWTRQQAAESLLKIVPEHPDALNLLIDLLHVTESWRTQHRVIRSLEKVGLGKRFAIDNLTKFIQIQLDQCSHNEHCRYICEQAAEVLGKIDHGNDKAIHILINLLDNEHNKPGTNGDIIWKLGDIGKGNIKAVEALTNFFERRYNSEDSFIKYSHQKNISSVPRSLCKIMSVESYQLVIRHLKIYLSKESYKNDFDRFKSAYEIVWHCAQSMSYPDFYSAWNSAYSATE